MNAPKHLRMIGFGNPMEDGGGDSQVKRSDARRDVLRRTLDEAQPRMTAARLVDHRAGRVDADDLPVRCQLGKRRSEVTGPAPDVEDRAVRPDLERSEEPGIEAAVVGAVGAVEPRIPLDRRSGSLHLVVQLLSIVKLASA